jgi:hypothetical protein
MNRLLPNCAVAPRPGIIEIEAIQDARALVRDFAPVQCLWATEKSYRLARKRLLMTGRDHHPLADISFMVERGNGDRRQSVRTHAGGAPCFDPAEFEVGSGPIFERVLRAKYNQIGRKT